MPAIHQPAYGSLGLFGLQDGPHVSTGCSTPLPTRPGSAAPSRDCSPGQTKSVCRCVGGLGTCIVVLKLRTAFGERISIFTPEYSRRMSRPRSEALAASLSIPTLPPAHTETKLFEPGGTMPAPALPM